MNEREHGHDRLRVEGSIRLDFSPEAILCAIGKLDTKLDSLVVRLDTLENERAAEAKRLRRHAAELGGMAPNAEPPPNS